MIFPSREAIVTTVNGNGVTHVTGLTHREE
jgi:hypothetical protein